MNIFTKKCSFLKTTMTLLLFLIGITANAERKYYDYYSTVEAYPSGAGLVYADVQSGWITEAEDEESPLYSDMKTPAESIDVKFINYSASGNAYFYANAKANDGWLFQGFSQANFDGEIFNYNDSVISFSNHPQINVTAAINFKSEDEAKSGFPMVQESSFYALFTHIGYRIAEGQTLLGYVKSSNTCNNIGDNVTLTAYPYNSKTTKFAYWIDKETGEKITSNPLTVNNISRSTYYVAHFDCDSTITIKFPDEGGYQMFYSEKAYDLETDSAKEIQFTTLDALQKTDANQAFQDQSDFYRYIYSKEPRLLYGKGEVTLVEDPTIGKDNNSTNELRWSGEKGVNIDTLTVTSKYYSIDTENKQFKLLPAGTEIAPNTAYWTLTQTKIDETFGENAEAPAVVYWYDPSETTGITNVKAEKAVKVSKKYQGIYNSLGQKVNAVTTKGLYIINGKAVYYRGK